MNTTDPEDGPFGSRVQAEAAFAEFVARARRGWSGPPGERLTFSWRQAMDEMIADAMIGSGAEVGVYDQLLITRVTQLLDPVDIGVLASWISRAAAAVRDELGAGQ